MNGRRRPSEAERLEHVQTLELLGHLIVQLPWPAAIRKEFVVFSAWLETESSSRVTQPLNLVLRDPAPCDCIGL